MSGMDKFVEKPNRNQYFVKQKMQVITKFPWYIGKRKDGMRKTNEILSSASCNKHAGFAKSVTPLGQNKIFYTKSLHSNLNMATFQK